MAKNYIQNLIFDFFLNFVNKPNLIMFNHFGNLNNENLTRVNKLR